MYDLTQFAIPRCTSMHIVAPAVCVPYTCCVRLRYWPSRTLYTSQQTGQSSSFAQKDFLKVGAKQRCLSDFNWALTRTLNHTREVVDAVPCCLEACSAGRAVLLLLTGSQRSSQLLQRLAGSRVRVPPSNA